MTKAVYSKRKHLSVSTLMDFVRCPRRYFYKKSGLTPTEEGNALLYGTAMHAAVPEMLVSDSLDVGFKIFSDIWDEGLANTKRNLVRARAQLAHYLFTHQNGRGIFTFEKPQIPQVDMGEDVSEYEIAGVIDIGLAVPLVVRVDGLVRHRDTGELWGWELKTTGKLNASLFDNLEFHPQILVEALVLRTLTELDIKGVIVEGILVDYKKLDNLCKPIPVYDHQIEQILAWLRFYGSLLLELEAQDSGEGERFLQNFAGCSSYSWFYLPSWICDYANLCRIENWRDLESLYNVKPEKEFIKLTAGGKEV